MSRWAILPSLAPRIIETIICIVIDPKKSAPCPKPSPTLLTTKLAVNAGFLLSFMGKSSFIFPSKSLPLSIASLCILPPRWENIDNIAVPNPKLTIKSGTIYKCPIIATPFEIKSLKKAINTIETPNIAKEVLIIASKYPPVKASWRDIWELCLAASATLRLVLAEAHRHTKLESPEQTTPNRKEKPMRSENLNPEIGVWPSLKWRFKGLDAKPYKTERIIAMTIEYLRMVLYCCLKKYYDPYAITIEASLMLPYLWLFSIVLIKIWR